MPDRPLVVAAAAPALEVRALVSALEPGRLVRRLRVLIDARAVEVAVAPPVAEVDRRVPIPLSPGRHRVSVVAVNDVGKERAASFEVEVQANVLDHERGETPRPPRLIVLSVGAGAARTGAFSNHATIPPIPFAAEDARDVAALFDGPMAERFLRRERKVFRAGGDTSAVAGSVCAAFDRLDEERSKGEITSDDTVVVFLESHVVRLDRAVRRDWVLGSDADPSALASGSIEGEFLVDRLGALADYGCRVLVLLDGVHEVPTAGTTPPNWTSRSDDLVRALYRRNVIAFTASIQGPSRRLTSAGHGAFAEALLGLSTSAASPLSLDAFASSITGTVQRLTERSQTARLYVPAAYPGGRISIFTPPSPALPPRAEGPPAE